MDCNLDLGAHLVTPRKWYSHHGVYVGNGRVVHYAGFSQRFRRGPVEEVSLEAFAKHFGFHVEPHATPAFAADEIVRRAKRRIGEDSYGLLTNNCEHFTHWCVSGRAKSSQVERFMVKPARVGRAIAGAVDRWAASMFGSAAAAMALT